MQQIEQLTELGQEEQKRVDRVVETLKTLGNRGENVVEVAHDARNMVTALDLYCDLLQQPGALRSRVAAGGRSQQAAAGETGRDNSRGDFERLHICW